MRCWNNKADQKITYSKIALCGVFKDYNVVQRGIIAVLGFAYPK